MDLFARARFLVASTDPRALPPDNGREVAFAGRSNAGKSSAINALVGRRSLARTSKTPGRTRAIQFYDLGVERRLVDLPGYGYARVPEGMRRSWEGLVRGYLSGRRALAGVVVVMDARRPFTALDRQLVAWCSAGRLPAHAVLAKADKLSRAAGARALDAARAEAARLDPSLDLTLLSVSDGAGVGALRARVAAWLEPDAAPARETARRKEEKSAPARRSGGGRE